MVLFCVLDDRIIVGLVILWVVGGCARRGSSFMDAEGGPWRIGLLVFLVGVVWRMVASGVFVRLLRVGEFRAV